MTTIDIPACQEPYNSQEVIDFISKVMDKFDQLKNLTDLDGLCELMKTFSGAYFTFKDFRQEMVEVLLAKNYVEITCVAMKKLMELGYLSTDRVWFPTFYVYNTLWNFSDCDQKLATAIVHTDIPKLLVKNIINETYFEDLDNPNCYYLMKASVSIVHNVARFPCNQSPFDFKELKSTLVALIRRNNSDFLGLISMLALSVLVGETELALLEEGRNTITSLIDHIKTALLKNDKRFDGFMIWELVNGLRCLSANDNMKKTLFEKGAIQVLIDVLKDPSNDDDIEKSIGTIWNLSFDKEIREALQSIYDIKNVIKPFENSDSAKIQRCYYGVLWMLEIKDPVLGDGWSTEKSDSRTGDERKLCRFDVFISFAPTNKVIISRIHDELMRSGLKVWMNVREGREPTLEAMADGIENSATFIMAVSEAYRTSANCRTEAEYAFQLNKTIVPLKMETDYRLSGWLDHIVGRSVTHDFSDLQIFRVSLAGLIKHLDRLGNLGTEGMVAPRQAPGDLGTQFGNLNIRERWSRYEIDQWLDGAQLGHLRSRFVDIEGPLFESLIEIKSEAPEYFYKTLRKDYRMTLPDILRLRLAINGLSQ